MKLLLTTSASILVLASTGCGDLNVNGEANGCVQGLLGVTCTEQAPLEEGTISEEPCDEEEPVTVVAEKTTSVSTTIGDSTVTISQTTTMPVPVSEVDVTEEAVEEVIVEEVVVEEEVVEEVVVEEVVEEVVEITYPTPTNDRIGIGSCNTIESWAFPTETHVNIVFAAECMDVVHLYHQRADRNVETYIEAPKVLDICTLDTGERMRGISYDKKVQDRDAYAESYFTKYFGEVPEWVELPAETRQFVNARYEPNTKDFFYTCNIGGYQARTLTITFKPEDLDSPNNHVETADPADRFNSFAHTIMPVAQSRFYKEKSAAESLAKFMRSNIGSEPFEMRKTNTFSRKALAYEYMMDLVDTVSSYPGTSMDDGVSSAEHYSRPIDVSNQISFFIESETKVTSITSSNYTHQAPFCFNVPKDNGDLHPTITNRAGASWRYLSEFSAEYIAPVTTEEGDQVSISHYQGEMLTGMFYDNSQGRLFFFIMENCIITDLTPVLSTAILDREHDIDFGITETLEVHGNVHIIQEVSIGASVINENAAYRNEIWVFAYLTSPNTPDRFKSITFPEQADRPAKAHFVYQDRSERQHFKDWLLVTSGEIIKWSPLNTISENSLIASGDFVEPDRP